MAIIPNSPQGIGGILDTGVKLFTASFKPLIVIAFLGGLAGNAAALLVRLPMMKINLDGGAPDTATIAGTVGLLTLVTVILSVVFYNAILLRVSAVANDVNMTTGEALGKGLRRFPAALGVGIMYSLAVLGGMLLLIIPGIMLSISLYCAYYLTVVDGLSPGAAIARSYRITKGSWWRVAGVLTVGMIIVIVITLLAGVLIGVMGFASIETTGDIGSMAMTNGPLWVDLLLVPAANGIYMALISCFLYAIAADLKLRHDGQDLLARAESLEN